MAIRLRLSIFWKLLLLSSSLVLLAAVLQTIFFSFLLSRFSLLSFTRNTQKVLIDAAVRSLVDITILIRRKDQCFLLYPFPLWWSSQDTSHFFGVYDYHTFLTLLQDASQYFFSFKMGFAIHSVYFVNEIATDLNFKIIYLCLWHGKYYTYLQN